MVAALLVAAVFGPSLFGDFIWDDVVLIENNDFAHGWKNLVHALTADFWATSVPGLKPSGYFRPVVSLAFLTQFELFGGSPLGFHLVNLVLHLACVAMVYDFLRRRLGTEQTAAAPLALAAALGAALFAVHPSRPETVTTFSSGCSTEPIPSRP